MFKKILCSFILSIAFIVVANISVNADTLNIKDSKSYFSVEKISKRITRIYGASKELMYLVEGDEKAVLIDTGVGIGNLKALVESLTDKEVSVLLTHGHLDHAMGAAQFDNVYMSTEDKEVYEEHSKDVERKSYLKDYLNLNDISEEDYKKPKDLNLIKPLNDGDVFSLGGVTLESIKVPGHTLGSMAILDKEDRILFLGDACNTFTFLFDKFSTSISEYKNSLNQLNEKTKGLYDTVYLSHGSGNVDKNIIENVLNVCDEVLNGTADNIEIEIMGQKAYLAKITVSREDSTRADGIEGNIIYSKIQK